MAPQLLAHHQIALSSNPQKHGYCVISRDIRLGDLNSCKNVFLGLFFIGQLSETIVQEDEVGLPRISRI